MKFYLQREISVHRYCITSLNLKCSHLKYPSHVQLKVLAASILIAMDFIFRLQQMKRKPMKIG